MMYIVKFKLIFQLALITSLCLLLCACRADDPEIITPEPAASSEEPDMLSGGTAKTPEQVLLEQPVDDTHDAFLVDTGGELGTLLVTAELDEETPTEVCRATVQFTIWDPYSMDEPLQTLMAGTNIFLDWSVIDANFDGFQDFGYLYDAGNHSDYWHYWLWDEELERFKYCAPLEEISQPGFNAEQQIVTGWLSSGAMSGTHCLYRWIDEELTLARIIKFDCFEPDTQSITIEDWLDEKMVAEYKQEYKVGTEEYDRISKWFDLDYHGE